MLMLKTTLTCFARLLSLLGFAQSEYFPELFSLPNVTNLKTSSYVNKIAVTEKNPSRVSLSWTSSDSVNEFFTIERSCNQRDFEIMAVLHVPSPGAEMEWTDESPLPGKLVYRLKTTQKNGNQIFGASTEVLIDNRNSLRIYPNPVDNVLIIRSEYPIDVSILDANGKLRLTAPNISGLQLVNVESLEKGIYLLRTYNRILNTLTVDRLIKN